MVGDVRLGITAKDAQMEVKNLTEKFKDLNAEMDEAAKNKDWASFNSLASAMNNLESYKKNIINESKGIPSNHPMQNPVSNVLNNGTNVVNTVGNGISAAGSGNVSGMLGAGSSLSQSAIKGLSALGVGAGATSVILGAAGLMFAGGAAAQKASQVWENQMDTAVNSNTFYNVNKYTMSAEENSKFLRDRFDQASDIRRNTMYSTQEVLELQNDMAKYGYDAETSEKDSRAIINAQANTNASRDSLTKLAGLSNLYGYDGAMAIQNVYQGLKDSGMTDARMDEFLNSVTQAMEEGVAKGFTGSVEDIVNNVTLFSRLSGGDQLWTGKNGADQLNKIGSGFANATKLNSTTDMWMMDAAKTVVNGPVSDRDLRKITGDNNKLYQQLKANPEMAKEYQLKDIAETAHVPYENLKNNPLFATELLMEQGSGSKFFESMMANLAETIDSQLQGLGGSAAENEEFKKDAYMSAFGLNNTGAMQLMSMMDKWKESGYASESFNIQEAQNIIENPENKTVEADYTSAINSIKDDVTEIGQGVLSLKNWFVKEEDKTAPVVDALEKQGVEEKEAKEIVKETEERRGDEGMTKSRFRSDDPLYNAMLILDSSASTYESKYNSMDNAITKIQTSPSFGLQKSSFISALHTEGLGTDERDKKFKEQAITYATKDGSGFSEGELVRLLKQANNDEEFKKAYYKGGDAEYLTALENLLKKVFGEITVTSR